MSYYGTDNESRINKFFSTRRKNMKELLKSKNRHILSDQKVTRISIDACSTTIYCLGSEQERWCSDYPDVLISSLWSKRPYHALNILWYIWKKDGFNKQFFIIRSFCLKWYISSVQRLTWIFTMILGLAYISISSLLRWKKNNAPKSIFHLDLLHKQSDNDQCLITLKKIF